MRTVFRDDESAFFGCRRRNAGRTRSYGVVGLLAAVVASATGCRWGVDSSASSTAAFGTARHSVASTALTASATSLHSVFDVSLNGSGGGVPVRSARPDATHLTIRDLPEPPRPKQLTGGTGSHRPAASGTGGAGLIVCEPVPAAGVDEKSAAFGAGCGDWLYFTVAGDPTLGQTPLLTSVNRARRERKLQKDLRLSLPQAEQIAAITGATHVAVGELTPSGGSLTLSYRLYEISSAGGGTKALGAAFTTAGNPAQIRAALPNIAVQMAQRLGVTSPNLPKTVDATDAELTALGRVVWSQNPAEADMGIVRQAARRVALASLCALSMGQRAAAGETAQTLLTRLAPDNQLAWGHTAYVEAAWLVPLQPRLNALRKRYPASYALAHTDVWRQRVAGNPKTERRAAEDAIHDAPRNPEAWLTLGYTLSSEAQALRRGRFAGGISSGEWSYLQREYSAWAYCTQRATELDPQHEVAWSRLAEAATFAGDTQRAEAALWKAEAFTPDKASVYDWGLEMFQDKWGGNSAALAKVAEHAAHADYPVVESAGKIAGALRDAGFDARANELLNRYMARTDERLQKNPNDGWAHWEKASLLWAQEKKSPACREYKEVVRLLPDNVAAHYDYAASLNELGAKATCIPEYRIVLKLDPGHLRAPVGLGCALKSEGQVAEAEKYLRLGLERLPNSMEGHFALGELYLRKKQNAAAAQEFKTAMALDGTGPIVYAMLTIALAESRQTTEAIHWGEEGMGMYAQAKEKMPREVGTLHDSLGWAYFKAKRYTEAVEQNEAAIAISPADLMAQENLGLAYNEMGRRADARKQWQLVVQSGAGQEEAVVEARQMLAKYPENGK